jgi:protein TonB
LANNASVPPEVFFKQIRSWIEPTYPKAASELGISGLVVLNILVSRSGEVENIEVVTGDPMLVSASSSAVRQWRYRPLLTSRGPTEMRTEVGFLFTLPGR